VLLFHLTTNFTDGLTVDSLVLVSGAESSSLSSREYNMNPAFHSSTPNNYEDICLVDIRGSRLM